MLHLLLACERSHRNSSRSFWWEGCSPPKVYSRKAAVMFLYVFLGECLAAKGGGECAAADSVASTGDNGSCDCAQYCASNWAGNVKRQRPNWKGATSVSGTAAGPTCTCVEATHWCDKPGNTKGCSNSCNWSGKPKPRALCNAEVWEIACTSGTPSAGWSGIGEEERYSYSVAACNSCLQRGIHLY